MKQIFKEEKTKVPAGKVFALKHDIEILTIDETGKPISLEHNTSCYTGGGFCIYTEEKPQFKIAVERFMEFLLKEDIYEFKLLRNSLSQEYRQIAEKVRKKAAEKYNF